MSTIADLINRPSVLEELSERLNAAYTGVMFRSATLIQIQTSAMQHLCVMARADVRSQIKLDVMVNDGMILVDALDPATKRPLTDAQLEEIIYR